MSALDILYLLKKEPRLSPKLVSERLNTGKQNVNNVLGILAQLKLVETPSRGIYEITQLGELILEKINETKRINSKRRIK